MAVYIATTTYDAKNIRLHCKFEFFIHSRNAGWKKTALVVHFLILTVTFSPRLNNAHTNTHFVYIFHQPHYQDRDIIFPIFYQFTHLSLAGRVRSEFFEYSPFGPDVYVTNVVDRPLR